MRFFSLKFVNRSIKVLLLFLFTINLASSFYLPVIAVFITKTIFGATLATVGISLGIYQIVKALIQIPLAKKLDARAGEEDDYIVIFIGAIIGIIYSFSYLLIRHTAQLYFLEILSGIGDACLMSAYYAIFSHHIDRDSEGFEWSLFSVGIGISAGLGGVIGGFVAQHFGFTFLFVGSGILNIAAAFLLVGLYPSIQILRKAKHYKTITHHKP
jgi:MFS family permease